MCTFAQLIKIIFCFFCLQIHFAICPKDITNTTAAETAVATSATGGKFADVVCLSLLTTKTITAASTATIKTTVAAKTTAATIIQALSIRRRPRS